jgi:predicted nucleic acid-binding protein
MNAVDTNILLYTVDEDEPAKRRLARAFLRQLGRTDEPLLMW